ncbi:hypothetical protein EDB89DRAFT_1913404 [Lactarius sanguifluus]|nr:hypothetical protein EDB89DRAFT_1913404 [Lactarius sanguifluus]
MTQLPKENKQVEKCFGMAPQLSKDDKKVVEWWWKEADEAIYENGFTVLKYSFSFDHPSRSWRARRSFRVILEAGVPITERAIRNDDKSPVDLTVVPPSQLSVICGRGSGTTCFEVRTLGLYTITVTPIKTPPQLPQSWWRRLFDLGDPRSRKAGILLDKLGGSFTKSREYGDRMGTQI